MVKFFLLGPFFLLGSFCYSQQPQILWQATVGDSLPENPNAIAMAVDGGFYFTGTNTPKVNGECANIDDGADVWVVRFDKDRQVLWQNCYGGSKGDAGYGIVGTEDGGVIIAATTYSNNGDVSGNHFEGSQDIWVLRLDSNGVIMWQRCYGGTSTDEPNAICASSDGGFFIVGYTYSDDGDVPYYYGSFGNPDAWVIKIDSAGDIKWTRVFGGTGGDIASDILETESGNYLISLYSNSTDYDLTEIKTGNSTDLWVIEIDDEGSPILSRTYNGNAEDYGADIAECKDKGILLAGITYSAVFENQPTGYHGAGDGIIVKLDSVGNVIWFKVLGGSLNDDLRPIYELPDGSIVAAGNTDSNDGDISTSYLLNNIWLTKLSSEGDFMWSYVVGGNDYEAIQQSILYNETNILFAAETESTDGDIASHPGNAPNDDWDAWVVEIGDFSSAADIKNSAIQITCSPNPFSSFTIVNVDGLASNGKISAKLQNLLGTTIKKFTNITDSFKLQREDLIPGFYFLELTTSSNEFIKPIKLIVQ